MLSRLCKISGLGLRASAFLSLLMPLAHATTTFTLNPADGNLAGDPGQTVGWGFTIVDDTFWLTVAGTGFCTTFNTSTDSLPCQPANLVPHGTYTDFTQFNFIDVAPGVPDTSQQTFDPIAQVGAGSFQIDANAPLGLLSGVVVIDVLLFDGDPLTGGNFSSEEFITAPATVDVVPEPNTAALALLGSCAVLLLRRKLRARV